MREAQGEKNGFGCLRTEGVWGSGERELNSIRGCDLSTVDRGWVSGSWRGVHILC